MSSLLLVVAGRISQVNLDDPVNKNPVQQLDESEDIEVLRIPLKSMMKVNTTIPCMIYMPPSSLKAHAESHIHTS